MIVDDRITIIGSANINDRSMMGVRDSEIACIITHSKPLMSRMNGKPFEVFRVSFDLRTRLFQEHLGIFLEKSRNKGLMKSLSAQQLLSNEKKKNKLAKLFGDTKNIDLTDRERHNFNLAPFHDPYSVKPSLNVVYTSIGKSSKAFCYKGHVHGVVNGLKDGKLNRQGQILPATQS
jgi:phosphatidylserine/phosphatidylglycerophosphate/cardiolipin synthase-like enzyme